MPFGFRKAIRIAPGVRINISKSGIGMWAGVRGLRIGTGPRGAYWSAGAGGFSYRQRIGGPPHPSTVPGAVHAGLSAMPTVTNTVLGRATGAGDDLALRYGQARRRAPYLPWFAGIGSLAVLCALVNWPGWLTLALFAGVVAGSISLAGQDAVRRRIMVEYHLDPAQGKAYDALQNALGDVAQCSAAWCVTTTSFASWKQHAGASALLTRLPARTANRPPAGFVTNVAPWTIEIPGGSLTFLPDRLLVVRDRVVSDARYRDCRLADSYSDFREDGSAPQDAVRVGTTWLHPNKNGDPDRRYAVNPQVPIFRYGTLDLATGTTTIALQFSRPGVAALLARALRAMP